MNRSAFRIWFLIISFTMAIIATMTIRSYAYSNELTDQERELLEEQETEYMEPIEILPEPIEPTETIPEPIEPSEFPTDSTGDLPYDPTEQTDFDGFPEEPTMLVEETAPPSISQFDDESIVALLTDISISLQLIVEIIKIAIACLFVWFFVLKPLKYFVF